MAHKAPTVFDDHPVISRDAARESGMRTFFTAEPCIHGHTSARSVKTEQCLLCSRMYTAAWKRRQLEKDEGAVKAKARAYRISDPVGQMLRQVKARASQKGWPFNITRSDIVILEKCPCCGREMSMGAGPRGNGPTAKSPSVDRMIPELGYVSGNVAVICWRCNDVKRNSTPAEMKTVIAWVDWKRTGRPAFDPSPVLSFGA